MSTALPLTPLLDAAARPANIKLRAFTYADHPALTRILKDPRVWAQGFRDGAASQPQTDADYETFIRAEIHNQHRILFAVELNKQLIGTASYYLMQPENARVELGKLIIDPARWGHGYMRTAAGALVHNAFLHGYHRVHSEADVINTRSIRLLTSIGFQHEGTRRHSSFHADGTRRDIALYAVTLDEWENPAWRAQYLPQSR